MPRFRPLQVMVKTSPHLTEKLKGGQVISKEWLWQDLLPDPSEGWDNRCDKNSPRSPDLKHKCTSDVLCIEGWSNPRWVKAELSAMTQAQENSGDCIHHGAPGQEYSEYCLTKMAGLNQAQLFESDTSTTFNAFKRGPKAGVNKNSFGSCGDVKTLCKTGQLKEALHILNQRGISADSSTYICLLQECTHIKGLAEGKQVHTHIIQSGFKPNIFLFNTLVNMYSKCGSVVDARQVFDSMPERTLFTWTIMITGYAKHGQGKEAFEVYEQMQQEGVMPNKVTFTCVLSACTSLAALGKGREVHANIIKIGIAQDVVLDTALVAMYAKCGSIKEARQVFDNIVQRNVVSWNTMITGYAQHGYDKEALEIYEQMIGEGVTPDQVTFTCVLNACASLAALEKGKEVHAHILKAGVAPDVILDTALGAMYAKCGSINNARQMFDTMAQRDVVSWSAMIAGYVQHGCNKEALEIYRQMIQEGVRPDKFTFTCVLNACGSLAALEIGKEVHADIIKGGVGSHVILDTALIAMYAKCGSITAARQVFNSMALRNVVAWSTMIAGYAQLGCGSEALEIYEQMIWTGVMPDRVTFTCVLNACANLADLETGKEVHADIIKAGIAPDIILNTALVAMYCKCGNIEDARQVFNNMAEHDVVSWSTIIAGYAQHGYGSEALKIYEQMIQEGMTPDKVTFTCVLNACASEATLETGREVHADIIKSGIAPDIILNTALVAMYCKCGNIEDARRVFDYMAERDVISWNAMIAGYAQHSYGRDALEIYEEMIQGGLTPDKVSFTCVLHACGSLAALDKGKEIHNEIVKAGIAPDIILDTALVTMYAKCGSIKDACQVFNYMAQRNVVSWNAMIAGYTQHGCSREALQLFEQMQQEGWKPNGISFTCVLSACSHVGLVDDGHHYFTSMCHDHGISPTMEHFGCMVDLLGRAGRLGEAEDFINNMPIEPDASVWGTLLGACRVHGDVELAERVADCLLKWGPHDAPTYALLSNIYAAAGRWDDRAKVRKMMEDKGIRKEPGCSWNEVGSQVHTCFVEDCIHNLRRSMMNGLSGWMKQAGYVPNTHFVLHDVEEDMKQFSLCHQ